MVYKLSPGRELDELVAKKIMGQVQQNPEINSFAQTPSFIVPPYSTDIGAAWEVVEKINRGGKFLIQVRPISPSNIPNRIEYICEVFRRDAALGIEPVIESTAALAICLGALKTID